MEGFSFITQYLINPALYKIGEIVTIFAVYECRG